MYQTRDSYVWFKFSAQSATKDYRSVLYYYYVYTEQRIHCAVFLLMPYNSS